MQTAKTDVRAHRTTLLILHSAEVVRNVLREILELEGFVVRATGDIGVAVAMVRESPPDLLLVGVYVADIDGHAAAVYLRQKCPNLAVLVVAGVPGDSRIEFRAEDEKFMIFPAPFPAAELVTKVKAILDADDVGAHQRAST